MNYTINISVLQNTVKKPSFSKVEQKYIILAEEM